MLQRILNRIREIRIRRQLSKAIRSTSGIEKVNTKFLKHIVNGLARSLSISLYKNITVVSSSRKLVHVYNGNTNDKGKTRSYFQLKVMYKKGCCETEYIVLKNPGTFWQIQITTKIRNGDSIVQRPKDALVYLGLAKLKS